MAENVTVIIHSAANISLKASYKQTVDDNCLQTLWLAQFGSTFKNLATFVFPSTTYVNCFLPYDPMKERIYELSDAEQQVPIAGPAQPAPLFVAISPSTHLTERLVISRNLNLPLLILVSNVLVDPELHDGPRRRCHSVDEIPVDLVANLILLHIMRGNTGIVHAYSQSYREMRFATRLTGVWQRVIMPNLGHFGNWHFSNRASEALADCSYSDLHISSTSFKTVDLVTDVAPTNSITLQSLQPVRMDNVETITRPNPMVDVAASDVPRLLDANLRALSPTVERRLLQILLARKVPENLRLRRLGTLAFGVQESEISSESRANRSISEHRIKKSIILKPRSGRATLRKG
ncbi:hypothetical protein B0H14DRAFT_3868719 [Mycena olivaceomarginata]|nr:hypothetical protein B0H14DRAFT_3868719 [Mycena olivaceomarginata]